MRATPASVRTRAFRMSSAVDCGNVIRALWDWLDGEMEPERLEAIRAHLAICRGCERHVVFARSFLDHVREAPRPDGDVDALRQRVRDVLGREGS